MEQADTRARSPTIGVAGARGRMGRVVVALAQARDDVIVGVTFDRPRSDGRAPENDAGANAEAALDGCDVIIDFSEPEASCALAVASAARGGPALVIGSTGLSEQQEAVIRDASRRIPIVKSGNFSLGVNLLAGLVEQAARSLPQADWDIEVLEAHHRRKIDSPSGTALLLGHAAARGRGRELEHSHGRNPRAGPRVEGEIGFSVVRGGGIIGEHSVIFAAEDEIITLSHSARDRSLFARGALRAALWVVGRDAGLYDMMDVLDFRDPPSTQRSSPSG